MKFRKKPVVIEAKQFTKHSVVEIYDWVNNNGGKATDWGWDCDPHANPGALRQFMIETLEGEHIATEGDWIIRGVKGEFYPCKPDIFEMTYEPAE